MYMFTCMYVYGYKADFHNKATTTNNIEHDDKLTSLILLNATLHVDQTK